MTITSRTLRSLHNARERVRDVAAARHSTAAHARDQATKQLEQDHDTLDEFLDEACTVLADVTTVHQLDRLAQAATELRHVVADATKVQQTAVAVSDRTASELRLRTRELRTLERVAERLEVERSQRDARTEQTTQDDLAARRR